ncbi:Protein K07C11.4 [Aphelenchoides avenae]|nr:Protein K07C11.4 [Aphelenchus avenae]
MSNGKLADIFLGIPYAHPPVGELRFEKPKLLDRWNGVLPATKFGPKCVPVGVDDSMTVSEDCLTLNVFRPHAPHADGHPVLVFIHGGGYSFGSAEQYGYANLTENFVSQGVIVVTIQYRLYALGFASTGDDVMPGNLGLWDMTTALQWLHKNVEAFGGRPDSITTWGFSSASANLISHSIQMSGSPFAEWAMSERPVTSTRELAAALDCNTATSMAVKGCLKGRPWQAIYEALSKMPTRREANVAKFSPRIDGDFFDADVPALIRIAPKKPTMMGIVSKEGIFMTLLAKAPALAVDPSKFATFNESDFTSFVDDVVPPKSVLGAEADAIKRDFTHFYLGSDEQARQRPYFFLEKYDEFVADLAFNVPVLRQATLQSQAGWPLYLYYNTYYNPEQFAPDYPIKGPTHANEYPYTNGLFRVGDFHFNELDRKHQRLWVEAIVSFAKTGRPTVPDTDWPTTSPDKPLRNLHIDLESSTRINDDLAKPQMDFWTRLTNTYSFDVLRGQKKETRQYRDEL